jgi:hypothetical protein
MGLLPGPRATQVTYPRPADPSSLGSNGTLMAHDSEKRPSAQSASVKQPRTNGGSRTF